MAMSDKLIEVNHVTKRFGDKITALDDCSLTIEKGEVDPSKPPQTEPGSDTADPGEEAAPDYLELAGEAYEKAMEYLQQMKEYLDLAGGMSEEPQEPVQDLDTSEDN